MPENDTDLMKEVRRIRDLLILVAMKSGASPAEVDLATGMGSGNIRARFPISKGRRGSKKTD